jgi:hypothetical protein
MIADVDKSRYVVTFQETADVLSVSIFFFLMKFNFLSGYFVKDSEVEPCIRSIVIKIKPPVLATDIWTSQPHPREGEFPEVFKRVEENRVSLM